MSYDLEEDTENDFTEYHCCDADSRRQSMVTDGMVIRDANSSMSEDDSIDTRLKLGSSISLTPSKNNKGRDHFLRNLTNIDYDMENITVKSNSLITQNIKRFKVTKILSQAE